MRLLLGGGGSGGHVFPALAVASALQDSIPEELQLLYLGSESGVEASIAQDAGVPFQAVGSGPLRGRLPLSQAWSLFALAVGVSDATRALRRFRPDAVLVTGGHASVPVGLAAAIARRPLVLFQPDIEAGWALRALGRLATRICVTDARSLAGLPRNRGVATGYPLRPVFDELDRPMARARFNLNADPALLVTGAVQGARRINEAVDAHLEQLLEVAHLIHVTGPGDAKRMRERRAALPAAIQHRYQVSEYLGDELPVAMAASDLAVSRAGASVLGEYPAAQLPAVLVPLPSAGGHQRRNAEVLAAAGAALIVENAAVADELLPTVLGLLRDPERLARMRRQAATKARPDAARRIAKVLWEVRR